MTEDEAWLAVRRMRWPLSDGEPVCPKCGSLKNYTVKTRKKFCCAAPDCRHQFTALSGTLFASHKKSHRDLLLALAYEGPINAATVMNPKTALNVRRRKQANKGPTP
jgi:transposase-like protein